MANESSAAIVSKSTRSPAYPSWSLARSLKGVQSLYEKDRFALIPLELAAKHLGYQGLNGASRTAIGSLRQFGLIAYVESGKQTNAKLTDLAKKYLLPHGEDEKARAIVEAFESCRIFANVLQDFPDRTLPSDETLRNRLIRLYNFNEAAANTFIGSLKESLAFISSLPTTGASETPNDDNEVVEEGFSPVQASVSTRPLKEAKQDSETIQRLPMPGTDYYLALPRDIDSRTARRMEKWIQRVVLPALQFAASDDEEDVD